MEETAPTNLPPTPPPTDGSDDILTPKDSLDAPTNVATTTLNSDTQVVEQDLAAPEKGLGGMFQNQLLRKVGLASGIVLVFIFLLVGVSYIFQKTNKTTLSQSERVAQVKDQNVKLDGTTASTSLDSLRPGVSTLFVNGDMSVQGVLRLNNGANYGQFDSSTLTTNQTYKLPNASGTICLDSGNCQFASAADLAAVQSTASAAGAAAGALEAAAAATKYTGGSGVTITGSVITNSGVLSVNGSVGDISLQGTPNQIIITDANGVSTFALPQDIGLSSTPTFGGLVLSSVGTQNGYNLCDDSNNCGFARGDMAILQGGNNYATDIIVGATDNYGLSLITNNTERLHITNNGAITIGGSTSDRITALGQFSGSTPLVFQGVTDDFFTTSLVITNPTSNRNIILPNADGTVCLSSGNCSGAGGYGDVLNGGNNFNSTMTLGTNDNFGFNLKTNNVNRITISNTGTTVLLGNVTSAADVTLGTSSANRLTINSEITGATPFIFQGATNDGFATTFSITDPTANHNITFPNADGTVCLSSGNCTGPVGTGDVLQGGNNFGGTMILGTNDNFGFDFKTNNTTRLTISNTGAAAFNGDLTVAGNNVFGASSTNRITFNGQVLGGSPLVFQGATDNAFATYFLVADPTATRTITLPNADGTICLSSGNCTTSGGSGDVNNGGNNFNSTMSLGTNDNFGLNLKTNNTTRLSITNGGQVTVQGNFIVNGDTLLGATSAQSVTFQAQNIFAPNDLNIDTYTQYINTTTDQVGFGTLPLGTARVSILATNAGDAVTVNNGQSAGNIMNLQDNGVNVVTVANEGATTFRNTTNSVASFQIQNAAGATIVNTDTTNRTLNINGGPSTYSFTPPGPILVASGTVTPAGRPWGVAYGNFNGDAYPDLVTANTVGVDNSSVFINNGNGTFATKVDYTNTVGSSPQYVATGDFNSDGRDDFAVANLVGSVVSVYLNNGNGTFAAKADYAVGSANSREVAAADFNGDGRADLVVTNYSANTVSVLISNANGTFQAKVDYATRSTPWAVKAGDVDGDGDNDLAVTNYLNPNGYVSILINNGNGTFATKVDYLVGDAPDTITLADFNNDNRPDIATGNYYNSVMSVLINNGNGTYGTKVSYASGAQSQGITSADFNGDGFKDIVLTNYTTAITSLYLGNGNGTFGPKTDYATGNVGTVVAADLNNDGKQDIAQGYFSGAAVGIMLGQGSSTTVKNSLSIGVPTFNETALFVKAASGQTADLIRVADSGGSTAILSLSGSGALYLRNTTNSTTAFQLQNLAGTNVLEADTTNSRVGINLGNAVTPSNTLTINGLTTADSTAQVALGTGAVGNKGLVIQGIASQTANLFETQTSTGVVTSSISATGAALHKNSVDSTAAFAIQNAAGTSLVNADTTNLKVSLSNTTAVLSAWTTSAQSLLGTRYNSTSGVYNGYVYLVGDEATLTPSYARLNADGTTGAWTASANSLPERRASAAGVIANGYYYLLGGQNATNKVNTVLYSKLNADGTMGAWQSAANTLPVAISGGAAVTANGYLYHIGGTTGSANNTVYYARINADGSVGTWTTSANSLPALRATGSATVSGGYVYYVGGSSSSTVYYAALNSDGSTGAWQTNANALPAVRNAAQSLVAFAGSLYLSGGMDASAGTNTTYYATLNGNGSTNAWATSAFNLPTTRAQNSNVVANGYLYVIGSSTAPTNGVYYTKLPGSQTGLTVTQTATTLYNSLTVQNADASTFINADIPTNTLTVNGATTLKSINSGGIGLTVQGAVGQTADLIQAQDSTGTSLFAVTAAGNISFGKEAAHSLSIADSTTTNAAGGALSVTAGSGNGTGAGGNLNLLAGQSGLTNGATAGTVNITAGSSGAGFGNAGNVNITAGNGFSLPGNITIQAGNNGFASYGSTSINTGGGKTMIGSSVSGFYLDSNTNLTVSGGNVSINALAVPVISTVSTGSSYYYVVTAYNSQGETLASNSVGMANNTSTITWSAIPGATGYKLYRNTSNSFSSGSLLRTTITVAGTTSFTDTGAATGAGLPPTTTTGTKTVVQAWSGQTGDVLQLQTSAAVNVLTVSSTGATLYKNSADSTTAFQLQNAAGSNLFSADTTNNQIKIGGAASATPTLLVLADGNSTDPTGTNGAIYYNSSLGKFRCYQAGAWTNCVGAGGGGGGDIAQGGNTFGVPVVIGASDAFALNLITSNTTRLSISATGAVAIGATGTAGTVEKLRVNTPTTVDNAAATILSTGATGNKALVVQGVASQAGNLQEWQDSTGTALLAVQSNGRLNFGSSTQAVVLASSTLYFRSSGSTIKIQDSQAGNVEIATGGGKVGINTTGGSVVGQLHITPLSAATIGTVIQGAASQTANLQEWQNSAGTVLASMSASGSFNAAAVRTSSGPQLTVTNDTAAYGGGVSAVGGISVYHWNSSINLTPGEFGGVGFVNTLTTSASGAITTTLTTAKAASVVLAVKGAASQSANLQEWQSSAGTVLAYVSSAGRIKAASGASAGLLIGTTAAISTTADAGNLNITNSTLGQYIGIVPTSTGIIYLGTATDTAAIEARRQVNISSTADAIKLQIQGAATQTTDLQQWQTNGGAVLASIGGSGAAFFKNSADSTTAFRIQNAAGTNLFTTDTTNNQIKIGGAVSATPTLFVFADGNSGTDPTGTNGAMYYNSSLGKFRCYQAGAWANCIGSGGAGSGDVNNGGNNYGSTMTLGTLDNFGLNFITANHTVASLSNTGAATFKNFSDSTAGFQVQNAAGTDVLTVDTTNSLTTVRAINSVAVLGSELVTSNAFNNATYWTCGAGWTTGATSATHTSGTATCAATASNFTVTAGTTYQITYTVAGNTNGTNYVVASIGAATGSNNSTNGTVTEVITATTTGALTFTPTGNFNGTISAVSVKVLTPANSALSVKNSSGVVALEVRANSTTTTFIGLNAGRANISGTSLVAVGSGALQANTTGGQNTALGANALNSNTTGGTNTAVGTIALRLNTGGFGNTGLGYAALAVNTTGSYNIGIGATDFYGGVLGQNSTGSNNTAIGVGALYNNINGSNNTALGYHAGMRDTATNFSTITTLSNSTVIGYNAQVQASNSLILGGADADAVKVGIGTTIPDNVLSVSPVQYSTGTASQTTTTVTGVGTTFTASMVGNKIIFADGNSATITGFTDATHLTVGTSQSVSSQNYRIQYVGFQVTSAGNVGINNVAPANKLTVNAATTADSLAQGLISTGSAANKGLVIQGVASQSANLLEMQSSTGTVLAAISSTGSLFTLDSKRALESVAAGLRVGEGYTTVQTVKPLSVNGGSNPTLGTVENLRVGVPTTVDNTSNVTIGTSATTAKGLVIQGVVSQSADLFQVQSSTGTVLAKIAATGNITVGSTGGTIISGNGNSVFTGGVSVATGAQYIGWGGGKLLMYSPAAGMLGFDGSTNAFPALKRVNAELQVRLADDSGFGQFSAGATRINSTGTLGTVEQFRVNTPTTVDNTAVSVLATGATTSKGLVIQGVASQTANLLEVQSSAGIVLASVDPNGNMTLNGSLNIATGSLQVAGIDRIDNTGSLVNVTYNGSTIAVAKGGTGSTSFTANGILFGNGTGGIQSTAAGNSGQCLNAVTGSAPVWASCTPAATGNINQGGNNFGSDVTLGATDNFGFNILANNFAVAKFSNTGQATFQNGTDSVTALQVQNAAGTSLFTIDSTNSRVYVGNPTADGTGTLLVLDTKNTSGDPTGVNGAMYYNSNLGKFRCYEAGSWKDCIYTQQTATKTSDQTFTSTSYADVSSLSFNVVANQTYKLSCSLLISVPSGTNGGNLSTNGPASPSQYTATFAKALDQSSGDNYATSSTYDDGSSATTFKVNTVSTGSNRFIVSYNSILVNGANSGTWSLRGKAFDGSSSITFYANSSCDLKPL